MGYPSNLRYTKEHEWVAPKEGKIGITDFAQKQLGDIVFVELPAVGTELTAGQAFGTVESVKAVSEVFAPVSGKVTAVNAELATHPEWVNTDPHGQGWLVTVAGVNEGEANQLMDTPAYEIFIAAEEAKH